MTQPPGLLRDRELPAVAGVLNSRVSAIAELTSAGDVLDHVDHLPEVYVSREFRS